MFDSLTQKFNKIFRDLRGYGRLSESNIKDALREIKLVLLEADVNYKVVKDFIKIVKEKSVGKDILESITPGQQIVKIVHDEMISLLGGDSVPIELKKRDNRIMVVGLQGAGKTTTVAKFAVHCRSLGHKPIMVALDVYRPAAIDQLIFWGKQIDIPVCYMKDEKDVAKIAKRSFEMGDQLGATVYIFDTAGRLHIDQEMMNELVELKKLIQPKDIMLVADSMTGQDAVNSVVQFNERLGLTGVILSKLDGDARGGAALSIRATTGCPIRYVGVGEKVSDFELFHPDRMVSRILGMGDVVTLVEKAQSQFDEKEAVALEKKIRRNELDLSDFLNQLKQLRKLGPLENLMDMIPGMSGMKGLNVDEKQLSAVEAIIQSMTYAERSNPNIIDFSRKKRISLGSGTDVRDVNQLLKRFSMMKKMMKGMTKNKLSRMGGKLWR